MSQRYLYEIINDLKQADLTNHARALPLITELHEWAHHQQAMAQASNELPMQRIPGALPIPAANGMPRPRNAAAIAPQYQNINDLLNPNNDTLAELANLTQQIQAECNEAHDAFQEIVSSLQESIHHWHLNLHRLEALKKQNREDQNASANIELLQNSLATQKEEMLGEISQLLPVVNSSLQTQSIVAAKRLCQDLPPLPKSLNLALIDKFVKEGIHPINSKLRALENQIKVSTFAYLTTEGEKCRVDLLNLAAFDELKALTTNPTNHESVQQALKEVTQAGCIHYWPQYFQQGISINLEHIQAKKRAYFENDFVQTCKDAPRLTAQAKTNLLKKFFDTISFNSVLHDDILYCAYKKAISLLLDEQPLNLEKIVGTDPRTEDPVEFLKIKTPGSIESFTPIDSMEDFQKAYQAGIYLRESFISTILYQFDQLHTIAKLDTTPEAMESIQQSMDSLFALFNKKVSRVTPDDNLVDIFKAVHAPRKMIGGDSTLPGIAHLAQELALCQQHAGSYNDAYQHFLDLKLRISAITEEMTSLERLENRAAADDLITITNRKRQLISSLENIKNEMTEITTQMFQNFPREAKIKAIQSPNDFTKKVEWENLKTMLVSQANSISTLKQKAIQLYAQKETIENALIGMVGYEAESQLFELEDIEEQIKHNQEALKELSQVNPQHCPFSILSQKYQNQVQGFYLSTLFKIPSTKYDIAKENANIVQTLPRDYRGFYFLDEENGPMACENLIDERPEDQNEFIKLLASTIEGTALQPGLITNEKDFKKISCNLEFLSFEQKKALTSFVMPGNFRLTLHNFSEVQLALNSVIVGGINSKVGIRDILLLTSGLKCRKENHNPPLDADIRSTFNPSIEEYFSTEHLMSDIETIQALLSQQASVMEQHQALGTIRSRHIPQNLQVLLLEQLPEPSVTPTLINMLNRRVSLDNFNPTMLNETDYRKLLTMVFEQITLQTSRSEDAREDRLPDFVNTVQDRRRRLDLREKYRKFFNAQLQGERTAKSELMGFINTMLETMKETYRDNTGTHPSVQINNVVPLVQEQITTPAFLKKLCFEYYSTAEIIDEILNQDEEILHEGLAAVNRDLIHQQQHILNIDNIVNQTSVRFQRDIVDLLPQQQDITISFNQAKDKFNRNLGVMQGRLSAILLAHFLPLDILNIDENLFHLQEEKLRLFNAIKNEYNEHSRLKTQNLKTTRLIENACLDLEKLKELATFLNENQGAELNLQLQDFDDFYAQLSSNLSDYCQDPESYNTIYRLLNLSANECQTIENEVRDQEKSIHQEAMAYLSTFLVQNTPAANLNLFLDTLNAQQKHQFILETMGPKHHLLQRSIEDVLPALQRQYRNVCASIDPANVVLVRDAYLLTKTQKERRESLLATAKSQAKSRWESEQRAVEEQRLAQERELMLSMRNAALEQELQEQLLAQGLENADPELIELLKECRILRSHLDTLALLSIPEQINEMNTVIFAKLRTLQRTLTRLISANHLPPSDQTVAELITEELALLNHLFFSKGLDLGAIAISDNSDNANEALRENVGFARGDNAQEIIQLRQQLEESQRQLDRDRQQLAQLNNIEQRRIEAERNNIEMHARLERAQQELALNAQSIQTPASILQNEGITGIDRALQLYQERNQGRKPSYKEAQGWLTVGQLKDRGFTRALALKL